MPENRVRLVTEAPVVGCIRICSVRCVQVRQVSATAGHGRQRPARTGKGRQERASFVQFRPRPPNQVPKRTGLRRRVRKRTKLRNSSDVPKRVRRPAARLIFPIAIDIRQRSPTDKVGGLSFFMHSGSFGADLRTKRGRTPRESGKRSGRCVNSFDVPQRDRSSNCDRRPTTFSHRQSRWAFLLHAFGEFRRQPAHQAREDTPRVRETFRTLCEFVRRPEARSIFQIAIDIRRRAPTEPSGPVVLKSPPTLSVGESVSVSGPNVRRSCLLRQGSRRSRLHRWERIVRTRSGKRPTDFVGGRVCIGVGSERAALLSSSSRFASFSYSIVKELAEAVRDS
jgi:hypothetical protein